MPYQVLNMKASPTMSKAESDEGQRNWNKRQLHQHNMNPRNFYDPTRQHINFELDSEGRVQPINTSPPINERMEKRCRQLGSKPPKKDAKEPRKRIVNFIVSGDTEVMRKLAFGNQQVDYTHNENKTTNVGLHREKNIELWAKDVYDFMCREFGKENIVGFNCHCDENTPHLHVSIVPVGPNNKVSFAGVFGYKTDEVSDYMRKLHTRLAKEVSSKWGMERGEDTTGRDVHHRDKPEYFAQLSRDIKKAEIRLKSLSTMVENLEKDLNAAQQELDAVKADIASGRGEKSMLELEYLTLANKVKLLEDKLTEKREKLRLANVQLAELRDSTNKTEAINTNAEHRLKMLTAEFNDNFGSMARGAMFDKFYPIIQALLANPETMKAVVGDDSEFSGLDYDDLGNIFHNTMQVFVECVMGGKTVSVGTGGGGSSSDLKWRDDDKNESYAKFMRRCLSHCTKSYKMAKRPRLKK